jgi:putative phosphoserine phosphatase/1-acylglycerol-3-phosphate O-acyltransferase
VDVVVLPPVRVEGWTQRDLGRRIAAVRQSFVDTLEHWPAGPGKRHARRKRREAS